MFCARKLFWNTTELIWTTFTTSWERPFCKVDLKTDINECNITFYRGHIEHRRWQIGKYHGTFRHFYNQPAAVFDAVKIKSADRHGRATEVLQYQSNDSTCAVFWILTYERYQLTPSYDLRIKDSYIKGNSSKNSECWQPFERMLRGRKTYRTYYRNCHVVLHKRLQRPKKGAE
ncbi:uncharacterized protein LOC119167987 isoform X2 [Rhipicephalus microplus]|uniref:uncharacterized protein LOC119167987 isoform X2 n=1 Tax=Rhipicephalus microplus TaxID=6941 RepID=UPI003F6C9D12